MYVVGEYTKQQLRTIGRTALQQMSLCANARIGPCRRRPVISHNCFMGYRRGMRSLASLGSALSVPSIVVA